MSGITFLSSNSGGEAVPLPVGLANASGSYFPPGAIANRWSRLEM
jgi:hypothetical protein